MHSKTMLSVEDRFHEMYIYIHSQIDKLASLSQTFHCSLDDAMILKIINNQTIDDE